jgi:SnoaL-like domain
MNPPIHRSQQFDDSARSELVVTSWIDAFNRRDLDAMLGGMHINVEFQPLWLQGTKGSYRGHDGVREWFAALKAWEHPHHIDLDRLLWTLEGEIVAVGRFAHSRTPTPFCAIHALEGGQIIVARHYLSDPETLLLIG